MAGASFRVNEPLIWRQVFRAFLMSPVSAAVVKFVRIVLSVGIFWLRALLLLLMYQFVPVKRGWGEGV